MPDVFQTAPKVLPVLKEIFSQEGILNIKNFNINPNSDLGILANHCSTLNIETEPTDSDKVVTGKSFDALLDYLVDGGNIARTECLEHTAVGLSTSLENGVITITEDINTTVQEITEKVEARNLEILKREKADNLIEGGSEPVKEDFKFINWEKLKSPSSQNDVIETACANANVRAELSIVGTNMIIAKSCFLEGFSDVSIDGEVKTAVGDKLKTAYANDTYAITEPQVELFIDLITSVKSYSEMCNAAKSKMLNHKEYALNSLNSLMMANDMETMCGSVIKHVSEILDEGSIDKMVVNIANVMKTVYAVKYFCLFNKETRFKDQLILTTDIINGEQFEEYTRQGGTLSKMYEFIKAKFKTVTMPLSGVTMTTVLNSDIEEQLAKVNNKIRSDERYIRSVALAEAFKHECSVYAKEAISNLEGTDAAKHDLMIMFSRRVDSKTTILGGHTGRVSDALYEIIINTFYADTLVKILFKYLTATMTDIFNNDDDVEITDELVIEAQAFAAADMVVEHLMGSLTK